MGRDQAGASAAPANPILAEREARQRARDAINREPTDAEVAFFGVPDTIAKPEGSDRVPMLVHPAVRDRLHRTLLHDPRFSTIGYSEFITRALNALQEPGVFDSNAETLDAAGIETFAVKWFSGRRVRRRRSEVPGEDRVFIEVEGDPGDHEDWERMVQFHASIGPTDPNVSVVLAGFELQ